MIRIVFTALFGVAILVAFVQGNYAAMFGLAVAGVFLHVLADELDKSKRVKEILSQFADAPASIRDIDPVTVLQVRPLAPAPAPIPQPAPLNHTLTASTGDAKVSDSFTLLVAADAPATDATGVFSDLKIYVDEIPVSEKPEVVGYKAGPEVDTGFVQPSLLEAPGKAAKELKARAPKKHEPAKKAEPKKPAKKPADKTSGRKSPTKKKK